MKLLIKNAYIVTVDEKNTVIPNGMVAVENDVITYVGENKELEADRVIDAGGKTLMPGLINAHTHVGMTIMRGVADDIELHSWLNDHIFPIEDRLNDEATYASSKLGMCEMIRGGVTSFVDMYFFYDGVARAARDVGIRADLGRCIVMDGEEGQRRIDETVTFYDKYESDMIHFRVGPHAIYSCPADTMKKCVATAEKLGTGLHIHLDETVKEHEDCIREHGMTPTAYLKTLGCLTPDTVLAHCVCLADEDIDILKECGCTVAHCPTSNLKLASGIAPIYAMIEKGVPVAIGSDGVASNNTQGIFHDMKLAALLQKGVLKNPCAVSAETAIRMATVNGARVLRRDDVGTLQVGKKADMILVDQSNVHQEPVNDRISNLVYATDDEDVTMTMINGKIVYEDGKFLTVDIDEVIAKAKKTRDRIVGGK